MTVLPLPPFTATYWGQRATARLSGLPVPALLHSAHIHRSWGQQCFWGLHAARMGVLLCTWAGWGGVGWGGVGQGGKTSYDSDTGAGALMLALDRLACAVCESFHDPGLSFT